MGHNYFIFVGFEYFRSDVPRSATTLKDKVLVPNPASQAEIGNHIVFTLVGINPHHYVLQF